MPPAEIKRRDDSNVDNRLSPSPHHDENVSRGRMHSRRNGWRRRRPSRDYAYDDTARKEAHREHGQKKTPVHGRAKNVPHVYRRIFQAGVRPGLRKSL